MSANPLLSIEGLTASVDEKTILHNVNLNVAAGETHVLMGPNGAGKSTLGHLVMGDPVYTVNDGRIVFDGQDITKLTTDKRSRAGLFLSFQARSRFRACRCRAFCAPASPAAPAWR